MMGNDSPTLMHRAYEWIAAHCLLCQDRSRNCENICTDVLSLLLLWSWLVATYSMQQLAALRQMLKLHLRSNLSR